MQNSIVKRKDTLLGLQGKPKKQKYPTFQEIKDKLKTGCVKGHKYNYSLDSVVQNFYQYDCEIRLSENEKELIITNFKPNWKNDIKPF